jgi:hypothetical protein
MTAPVGRGGNARFLSNICQPLRLLRDRVAVCCDALLKLYTYMRACLRLSPATAASCSPDESSPRHDHAGGSLRH